MNRKKIKANEPEPPVEVPRIDQLMCPEDWQTLQLGWQGAPYPKMSDFKAVFESSYMHLKLERRPWVAYNGLEIEPIMRMATLLCPDCDEEVGNTDYLLKHILEKHESDEIRRDMELLKMIPERVQGKIDKAIDQQRDKSFYILNFLNSKSHRVLVPISSPMFPFVNNSHIQLYLDECPFKPTYSFGCKLTSNKIFDVIFIFDEHVRISQKAQNDRIRKLLYGWQKSCQSIAEQLNELKKPEQKKAILEFLGLTELSTPRQIASAVKALNLKEVTEDNFTYVKEFSEVPEPPPPPPKKRRSGPAAKAKPKPKTEPKAKATPMANEIPKNEAPENREQAEEEDAEV